MITKNKSIISQVEKPFFLDVLHFTLLEINKNMLFSNFYLLNINEVIINGDWCIITNPYDGDQYIEQCKKVSLENKREIFYGMEGTRCLLIDAVKIVGTTNTLLKEVNQIIITEEMLREYYNKPLSFMEEDLLW